MMRFNLARVPTLFLLAAGIAAAADGSFTGSWKLNPDRSEIHGLPVPPARLVRVDHEGTNIDLRTFESAAGHPEVMHFTTDGGETKNRLKSGERSSMSKWEGSALLINTIVNNGPSNYTEMDHWKLSRDGRTLTIRRQIVSPRGETESTLVYDRQ